MRGLTSILGAFAERLPGLGPRREIVEEQPEFDADAALARYMASRPSDLPPPSLPVESDTFETAPRRRFGRKGL